MYFWVTNTGEVGCTNNPGVEPLIYGIKNQYKGDNPLVFVILTKTNAFMFGHFNGTNIETMSIDEISISKINTMQTVFYVDVDIKGSEITDPLTYLKKNIADLNNVAVIFPNIDKKDAFSIKYNKIDGFNDIERSGTYANIYNWFDLNDFEIPFYDNEFIFVAYKGAKNCSALFGGDGNSDSSNGELAISIQF